VLNVRNRSEFEKIISVVFDEKISTYDFLKSIPVDEELCELLDGLFKLSSLDD
jgi:hypothetical protein